MAISGHEFWNKTKFGQELMKICPHPQKRVIIDIQPMKPVTIYIACLPDEKLFNVELPPLDEFKIINSK